MTIRNYFHAGICGLLVAYIAVLPFKPLLVLERNGFLVLLGLLVLWCAVNRKLFYVPTPFDRMLLALVAWVGITLPFSVSPLYSVKEYGKLLQHMVVFYAVLYFMKDHRWQRFLITVLGVITVVVAGYGLTQFDPSNGQAAKSFFPSEIWLTTFLVMLFPFVFALSFSDGMGHLKWTGGVLSVLVAGCLVITQSRAGLVSLLVELGVVAWLVRSLKAGMVAATTAVIVIAAMLFAINVDLGKEGEALQDVRKSIPVQTSAVSIYHRFDIWRFTLSEIAKHGLVGIGYGGHSYLFKYGEEHEEVEPGRAPVKRAGTHNIFLYHALHVGLPGMVLFGWLYGAVLVKTAREYWAAAPGVQKTLLAGATGAFSGLLCRLQFDQMLVGSLAVLFWALVGLTVLQYREMRGGGESEAVVPR